MVRESYSTLRGVTCPIHFKKSGTFIGDSCFLDFPATSCHPSAFIDLKNTAQAKKRSVKTICMVSGSEITHMVVTSPVNSKQPGRFFLGNSWSRKFAVPSCHSNTFIDLANTFLANKRPLETICTVSGSKSTHMGVTGTTNFKKLGPLFQKTLLLHFAALFAIQALLLTSQFSPSIVKFREDHMVSLGEPQYPERCHWFVEF